MRKLAILAASMAILSASLSVSSPVFAEATVVSGEVKKVDMSAGKITLKHGPITNLDMDSMTMVFRVQDSAMIEKLKPGDKVKFTAERVNGAITVTTIKK
jgi:Cu(I)/Ag(I) efflux system protein CusF